MNRHDSPPGGHGASGRQDITDPATGGSRLLSRQCATCILRHGDPMHLGPERLRVIIGRALAAGSFVVCHDTLTYGDYPDYGPAICRGFFDAYSKPVTRADPATGLPAPHRGTTAGSCLAWHPPGIDQPASGDDEAMSARANDGRACRQRPRPFPQLRGAGAHGCGRPSGSAQ